MDAHAIRTVACLGTGTMGHAVAFLAARAGYMVRLFGRTPESVRRGLEGIERASALYRENGLLSAEEGAALRARVTGFAHLKEAVQGADLVMESVAEDLAVKHAVCKEVEAHCAPDAILGTNTSSLSLTAIAAALQRPERFLGIHFFNPPHLMPTVEVCPGPATLPPVRALAANWVASLGNMPVLLEKEVQGYLINRIQCACLREALHIVEQGWASAETVDKAVSLSLGRRYSVTGPLESADMGGLEVFSRVLEELNPELGAARDAGPLLRGAVARGDLGIKTGKGVYDWPEERVAERRKAREDSLLTFLRQDKDAQKGR